VCDRAGRQARAVSPLISMIAKGFTPRNGAKVFAIMELSLAGPDLTFPLVFPYL